MLKEENVAADKILQPHIVNDIHSISCMDSESVNTNNNMVMDELLNKEACNTKRVIPDDKNVCNPNVEIYELNMGTLRRPNM